MNKHLISPGADAALRSLLAKRHDVEPDRISLVSLDAQPKAWSDETGTLWDATVDVVYTIDGQQQVLEISEGEAAAFLDELSEHIQPDWHGEHWPQSGGTT